MSRIKYYIFVFLACFCSLIFAQQIDDVEDIDVLSLRLQSHLDQAKLDSDRGDYYNAQDNLDTRHLCHVACTHQEADDTY